MLVLDTDVLTIVQRKTGPEYEQLIARFPPDEPESVCVTIISFEEQARGWLAFLARAKDLALQIEAYLRLHMMLEDYTERHVLPFDERAAQEYRQLKKAKVKIGTMDLKIAAIALANDATLLSRNLRDFSKVPQLRVEDCTIAPKE
jgi:tRNA(fMet)-specific endonuclease VapC